MNSSADHVDDLVERWSEIHPDVDLGSYPALVRLIRSGQLLQGIFERVAQQNGLTVRGDYDVLAALRRAQPNQMQPTELARVSLVSNSGMTGRLDRLEDAGLIRRGPHPDDRRALLISITERGIQTVDQILGELVEASSRVLVEDVAQLLVDPLRRLTLEVGDAASQ